MRLHEEILNLRKKEKFLSKQILDKLQVMEDCRGYLALGYSSLFDYLVRGLKYSESAAYHKQSCIRLVKELPEVKQKLEAGDLTSTSLSLAFKTLRNKSISEKRQILRSIEKLPTREVKKALAEHLPLAPAITIQQTHYQDKVVLRLELSKAQASKIEKLKKLSSHQGDLAGLLEILIDKELRKFENTKVKVSKSRNPRFISKALRNSKLKAAEFRCQFPGCESDHYLQVDHIQAIARGGTNAPENLQVLCATHNQWKGKRPVDANFSLRGI